MKNLTMLAIGLGFSALTFAQSKITPAKPGVTYGKVITADNALNTDALTAALGKDSVYTGRVTGKVVEVCTAKGCFIKLARADGNTVMVQFTGYAYFMPPNIIGKTVVVEGKAKVKETTVEQLKHFAGDAGKSKEEIAMINQPKKDVAIMADGVLVVK